MQYGTFIYALWDLYIYSVGHIHVCIHHGTSPHIICDIYLFINGHLSIQYGTSTYAVWDIYLCSMGHICIQYGIRDIYLNCTLFLGDWLLGCYFLVIGD